MVILVPTALSDLNTRTDTLADGRVMVARRVHASADEVWAILADGWQCAAWMTGISRVRHVDRQWPCVGSRLDFGAGPWPLTADRCLEVVRAEPGRLLLLLQSGRGPIGAGRLRIMVSDARHGCVVRIALDDTAGPARLFPRLVRDRLMTSWQREAVRRLALLAEGQHTGDRRQKIGVARLPQPTRRRIS